MLAGTESDCESNDVGGGTIEAGDPSRAARPVRTHTAPPPGVTHDSLHCALVRGFDFVAALGGIILMAPALLLIAIAVRLESRGPAFFVHNRIGQYGVPFPCLKFRTMVIDADRVLAEQLASCGEARAEWQADFKLRRDPRVTQLGRFLRKFSLDELPQLFNILAGHMSVVGPRPIIEAEVARYGRHFAEYCSVRPGLTGPWQISGRNDVSYEDRVLLDSRYVHSKSLLGDLAIISRTMQAVVQANGSY